MTVKLRDKSDRFVYTKLGEQISDRTMAAYMGKVPICFLSDAALDVINIPCDKNTNNVLPSNMLYVASRYVGGKLTADTLTSIQTCYIPVKYTAKTGEQIELSLVGPLFAAKKIGSKAREVLAKFEDFTGHDFDADLAYAVWDQLMYDGVKGLFEVRITRGEETYGLDVAMACEHFMYRTYKRNQSVSGLQLK